MEGGLFVAAVGGYEDVYGVGACGFAKEGDAGGVAAEVVDVGLDPVEAGALVEEAEIAFGEVGDCGGDGEAECCGCRS